MSRAAKARARKLKGKYRVCEEHGRVLVTAWGAHMRHVHGSTKRKPIPKGTKVSTLTSAIFVGTTKSNVVLRSEGKEIPIALFIHGGSADDLAKTLRSCFEGKPPAGSDL